MATPSAQQAREQHAAQAQASAAAATAVAAALAAKQPWAQTLSIFASYQLAAAQTAIVQMAEWLGGAPRLDPRVFAGVSAHGYSIAEPLIATIDNVVPAPAEAIPAPWWKDTGEFARQVQQLVASEVQDAARSAAQAEMAAQGHTSYVRVLVPPSCKRCAVLAGRIYRWSDGFERHPGCDCINAPCDSLDDAMNRGLVVTPDDAYQRGWIRDLTDGEKKALDDGADITQVINSSSGVYTANAFGQRVKATRSNASKRATWRRANPSLQARLRPEAIYQLAGGDRDKALALLQQYGYLPAAA